MARTFAHYEVREPQLEMARRVMDAINTQQSTFIEAPTGIGKSFAYLIPAILSGKQVIVSTGYKALQDQLIETDVPALQNLLDCNLAVEVAKGRNNYICHHKWFSYQQEFAHIPEADRSPLPVIDEIHLQLQDSSFQGDVECLEQHLPSGIRAEVVSLPDDCLQHHCRHASTDCYVNAMRARAFEADLIITNHYLLLHALLMSREMGEAMFLPYPDVYIIDEAHHLEQVATHVFSIEVTSHALSVLFGRSMFRRLFDLVLPGQATQQLRDQHQSVVAAVSADITSDQIIEGDLDIMASWAAEMQEVIEMMEDRKADALKQVTDPDEFEAEFDLAVVALQKETTHIKAMAHEDPAFIRFVEKTGRTGRTLKRVPLLPEEDVHALLFDTTERPVICTSATLTTHGSFDHFKRQCGLATGDLPTYRMDYIFDYRANALLYQPVLPEYHWQRAEAYYEAVAAAIRNLLEVTRGRALCLFTSWQGLDRVTAMLQSADHGVIWPVRSQREGQKRALIRWFMDTPHSVLCATRSFWEGVDIPGDKLVSVVLDKLPFPNPRDPIHKHRQALLQDMYGEGDQWWAFREYAIPHMALALKQGFGRLLRRTTDRGVVTILDTRLTTRSYGQAIQRDDLPPAQFTRRIRDVYTFFQSSSQPSADYGLNLFPPDDPETETRAELTVLRDGKSARIALALPQVTDPRQRSMADMVEALGHLRARIENRGRQIRDFRLEIRCPHTRDQLTAYPQDPLGQDLAQELDAWSAVDWIELTNHSPNVPAVAES